MRRPLQIGVVGCGYWGPNLVRNFRMVPGCKVKTVCDQDEKRLASMQELYPEVGVSRDFNHLLKEKSIDAIAIATPVKYHHEQARAALDAGKHVLIEKPMAASAAQCEDLCKRAKKLGLTLMVDHTYLYSSPVRKIKEIVDGGDIGELRYIAARRLNLGLFQADINVTWDLAPHDLSIILYIMGKAPVALNCQGANHIAAHLEHVSNLSLFFPRGEYATVHNSWLDPRKVREMTVVGSRRMIHYDDLEPIKKITIYDVRVESPPHYNSFEAFHYSYHYGDMYTPYIKQEEPLKLMCEHFIDSIMNESTPLSDGRQGHELVSILEASLQSLEQGGGRVKLPLTKRRAATKVKK
ncbi:MAG: Gfo/Idh/MocA family protein [Kiritimatiellia bacterium]